jgi:hypothetical protein
MFLVAKGQNIDKIIKNDISLMKTKGVIDSIVGA